MKKIARLIIVIILMLVDLNALKVKAYTISMTTKEFLNFEILDTVITNDGITIKGWAFINENQHYRNTSDHAIQLEFISVNGSTIVDAELTNTSMTSSNEQVGLK